MNTSINSRGRVYVSSSDVRRSGFRPGQKLAVARTGSSSVEVRPFNQVKRNDRIASYTVEPTGALRMSSNKVANGQLRNGTASPGRNRLSVQF